jgi:hypothetical protein
MYSAVTGKQEWWQDYDYDECGRKLRDYPDGERRYCVTKCPRCQAATNEAERQKNASTVKVKIDKVDISGLDKFLNKRDLFLVPHGPDPDNITVNYEYPDHSRGIEFGIGKATISENVHSPYPTDSMVRKYSDPGRIVVMQPR